MAPTWRPCVPSCDVTARRRRDHVNRLVGRTLLIDGSGLSYDDIVQAVQNTTDSCINSATDRRGYVLKQVTNSVTK